MTAPSTRDGNSSHLDVTPREFERRLAAHGHSSDEIHLLWNELAVAEPVASETGRKLGLGSVIAVYLGLLLVVTASVSLLAIYWNDLDSRGVLSLALSYLAAYLVTGEILRRRELAQPADVLEAVAVGWVGLATYAVLDLVGAWPEGASDLDYIHSGLTTIAVVVLAAALLLLVVRPDPLLLVPIAIATGLLAVDLGEIVSGSGIDDLSERQIAACILPLGLAWIATGLWLDVQQRRRYATWAHWVGLVGSAFAIIMIVPKTVPGFALVGALGAVALFFSALVRHWSFTVIGALGVLMAVISAMGMLGGIAPLVIAIVGLALILVGLRWSRWRESIRTTALARMPDSARDLVTRLAPPS